jgi:hypothetical protein
MQNPKVCWYFLALKFSPQNCVRTYMSGKHYTSGHHIQFIAINTVYDSVDTANDKFVSTNLEKTFRNSRDTDNLLTNTESTARNTTQ